MLGTELKQNCLGTELPDIRITRNQSCKGPAVAGTKARDPRQHRRDQGQLHTVTQYSVFRFASQRRVDATIHATTGVTVRPASNVEATCLVVAQSDLNFASQHVDSVDPTTITYS